MFHCRANAEQACQQQKEAWTMSFHQLTWTAEEQERMEVKRGRLKKEVERTFTYKGCISGNLNP